MTQKQARKKIKEIKYEIKVTLKGGSVDNLSSADRKKVSYLWDHIEIIQDNFLN